jgi:hypothetical protein
MNAEKPSLTIALKTLWGAAQMPFGDACSEPYRHPSFEELTRRLQQLCDIGASGLLHGANGVGKVICAAALQRSCPKNALKSSR